MRINFFTLLLCASILLNGFFLGGFWFASYKADSMADGRQRIKMLAKRLQMTPEQKRLFKQLRQQALQKRKEYTRKISALREEFWESLAASSGNSEDVNNIIHRMAVERERFQVAMAGILNKFIRALDPKQQRLFFKLAQKNRKLNLFMAL